MCELCNVIAAGHLCGANCSSSCPCSVYPVQYDFVASSLTLSAAPNVHGPFNLIVAVQPLQLQRGSHWLSEILSPLSAGLTCPASVTFEPELPIGVNTSTWYFNDGTNNLTASPALAQCCPR